MSRKPLFKYIGDKKKKDHSGIITVASIADFETGKVSVGLSFCSPSDPFRRWKGRMIAEGRMKKYPIILNFKTTPRDAISKFLYGLVSANWGDFCDHVEVLPKKASQHFPVHFPWFNQFILPAGILRVIPGGGAEPEKVEAAS